MAEQPRIKVIFGCIEGVETSPFMKKTALEYLREKGLLNKFDIKAHDVPEKPETEPDSYGNAKYVVVPERIKDWAIAHLKAQNNPTAQVITFDWQQKSLALDQHTIEALKTIIQKEKLG
jgi:hypothetical protein